MVLIDIKTSINVDACLIALVIDILLVANLVVVAGPELARVRCPISLQFAVYPDLAGAWLVDITGAWLLVDEGDHAGVWVVKLVATICALASFGLVLRIFLV